MNKKAVALVASLVVSFAYPSFSNNSDPFAVDLNQKGFGDVVDTASEEESEIRINNIIYDDEKNSNNSKSEFPVTGTVQGNSLRLRKWPWGPVCGSFNTGDKVRVTGVSGEFYAVEVKGKTGYLHRNYVSIPGAKASRKAPYYPGNTATGGYLDKDFGTTFSNSATSSYSSKGNSRSSLLSFNNNKYSTSSYSFGSNSLLSFSGKESSALSNYDGGKLSPNKFISTFGPAARDSMKVTGIPASVTMAQAILETGWGGSSIGNAKNLFGIKGTGPAGTVVASTKECYGGNWCTINDGFKKYNTWEQSISDHASLLQTSRYASALNTYNQNKNANQYAYAIQKAGYATDPNYGKKLVNLMDKYNLYQWDV